MDIISLATGGAGALIGGIAWKAINLAWDGFQIKKMVSNGTANLSHQAGLLFKKKFIDKIKDEDMRKKILDAADSNGDTANEAWDKGIRGIPL